MNYLAYGCIGAFTYQMCIDLNIKCVKRDFDCLDDQMKRHTTFKTDHLKKYFPDPKNPQYNAAIKYFEEDGQADQNAIFFNGKDISVKEAGVEFEKLNKKIGFFEKISVCSFFREPHRVFSIFTGSANKE